MATGSVKRLEIGRETSGLAKAAGIFRSIGGRWPRAAAACALALVAGMSPRPLAAREAAKPGATLELVPDNAAFYSSMLRNRERFEAIAHSRAWAKFKAIPVVQMGWALYAMQAINPNSGVGKFNAALQDPEVRKTLAVLGDMMSEEVFCYGDASMVDFVDLSQRLVGAMRYGPTIVQLSGQGRDIPPNKLQGRILLSALVENLPLLKVPDVVFGFKVSDVKAAQQQLNYLEKQATEALEKNPQLQGRLKKTTLGGHSYLTLSLDGKLVPWDRIPADQIKEIEAHEGDFDKVVARLKQMNLVIAVGLRDDYLLLSIGSSTDALTRLGQGKHLASRPELAPLQKFAGKRLISIAYLSKAMSARLLSNQKDLDQALKAVQQMLPSLPTADRDQIGKDVAALVADLKTIVPEPGAMMGLSFLTERGIEGYQYTWGDHARLDGSKPLDLLQHVGGSPTMAAVNRVKVSAKRYDLLAKWFAVGYRYFEKYAVPRMHEKERGEFQKFAASAKPLLGRLDRTTREMLLPALADGQVGIVLDTKLKSKQFAQALPATDTPLRMLEPALVLGVSNAELLRKACRSYKDILNDLIDAARKIEGSKIPADFRIPDAKVVKIKNGGTFYTYPLPKSWGVEKKVRPNAGLSSNVAVLSLSTQHSTRLLKATPPSIAGRPIPTDRPLAAAAMIDFAGLVDAATPWIDLGVQQLAAKQEDEEASKAKAGEILAQVHSFLDVLKVVRTITSESYLEQGALVSHTELEIRDIAAQAEESNDDTPNVTPK
jgi:hypothetical protein